MKISCIKCKGRRMCGRSFCPIVAKSQSRMKVKDFISKEEFQGSSPAPFIGHFNYPNVNIGILSPPEQREDAWLFDAPTTWGRDSFQIQQIIDLRSNLINSRTSANVKDQNKIIEIAKEVGMASKPVDIDFKLKEKPSFGVRFENTMAPMGPNAKLERLEVVSNPRIEHKVDRIVSDGDFKAIPAILKLYNEGFDENFLSKLLSVGNVGMKTERRLVPTRWSITATDDMIGNNMIEEIKDYETGGYELYYGGYLGNNYFILVFPEVWSYELFETYLPKSSWNTTEEISFSTDYEPYEGRKNYAQECAGGYYAARLPILQKFKENKKQASVLALRFIDETYWCPLGVWVVREAVKKEMSSKPMEFGSKELMITYIKHKIMKNYNYDVDNILNSSKLVKNLKEQKKLSIFFGK